ncbi:hypothetical protein Btru_056829 [Bulinus truncatus]|nr:hypothetical protein Btru_056829 [Bulinus truncatus]
MPSCCVPDCSNSEKTQPLKTFHRFPLDPKRRQIWINALQLDKEMSNSLRICSDHFLRSDFQTNNMCTTLKKTAEPFCFLAQNKALKDIQPIVNDTCPIWSTLPIMGKWIVTGCNSAINLIFVNMTYSQ